MFGTVILFSVASVVTAQDSGNSLSTVQPSQQLPSPFMDLLTGASSYLYPESIRKVYSDPLSYVSCPKTDTLSSFASILGSAAKIMLATAALVFLKLMGAKLMLLPVTMFLVAKIGLKAALLWPMISKMIKYFKKKKKKYHGKSRMIRDCSQRIACIIQRSVNNGWGSNLGAAFTFTLIEDVEDDSPFAKTLLDIFAGEKVSKCMSMECSSGVDIS